MASVGGLPFPARSAIQFAGLYRCEAALNGSASVRISAHRRGSAAGGIACDPLLHQTLRVKTISPSPRSSGFFSQTGNRRECYAEFRPLAVNHVRHEACVAVAVQGIGAQRIECRRRRECARRRRCPLRRRDTGCEIPERRPRRFRARARRSHGRHR